MRSLGTRPGLLGVRSALASLLVLLDSEPRLARVWLVESLAAGPRALECRERNMRAMLAVIVDHWPAADAASIPPLAPEGSFGSVLAIVVGRVMAGCPEPLVELLGPLMGVAVAPYLDQRPAAREIERAAQLASAITAGEVRFEWTQAVGQGADSRSEPSSTAGVPSARRACECLLFLADHPDVSNSELARGIGIAHASQMSRLLSLLAGAGLVCKCSRGAGLNAAGCRRPARLGFLCHRASQAPQTKSVGIAP
jgi:hypothetical protein